jgi:hypothetical protein
MDFIKLKHGQVNQETGLVFWAYDQNKRERWVTSDKFKESRQKANQRAKTRYWADPESSRQMLREWHHNNKEKKSQCFKNWQERNKHKLRDNRLMRTYGLSNDNYIEMFESQIGLCAICKEPQQGITKDGETRFLCVDHCHQTGKVRHLLCAKCNAGLGQFRDNPEFLTKAAKYIIKHQTQGITQE